jgi:N-acetylglutamate synthase-like GNAT family acetyltransferase
MSLNIRPAIPADRAAVAALVSREAARGVVLPRAFAASDFLVAELDGRVAGTLSTSAWTPDVLELGTVISDAPGRGIGGRLVQAGLDRATSEGRRWAVVLTGMPAFFARQGFRTLPTAPWARAQGPVQMDDVDAMLDQAIGTKAAGSCLRCPQLGTCTQSLMALPLAAAMRRCA